MKNRVALITGASAGIGREFAFILAREGYDLVLVARRPEQLESVRTAVITSSKTEVMIIAKDLTSERSVIEIYDELNSKNLQPEILINNAGFGTYGEFAESEWVKEKQMIDLNISALVQLTHLFLPGMIRAGKGKIVNVASTAAFQPGPLMSVYYASKAFVLSFSEAIAEELTGKGITVTALCPGPTESEFSRVAGMEDTALFKSRKIPDAKEVAEFGYYSMMRGKRVAIHGTFNYILANSVRFTPRKLVTKVVRYIQRRTKR